MLSIVSVKERARAAIMCVSIVIVVMSLISCGGPAERKAEHREAAERYFAEGNFPKARVALRNVLKIDPNDHEGYFLYAQVEEKEKNWRNAFQHYLRVVELNPSHRGALLKLGRFYLESRQFEKVDEIVEKTTALDPQDIDAQSLRLAATAAQGHIPEAISELEVISQRHPTHPEIAILLAVLYTTNEQFEKALNVLRPAADADPSNVSLLASLSEVYSRLKDWPNAERMLMRIVDIEPAIRDHHIRLAAFYQKRQESDKARSALRQAIVLEPEDEYRRLVLAELLVTQKDYVSAEATLMEAREALPYATRISFALADLYEMQKHRGKARNVYQQLIEETEFSSASLEAQVKLATFDVDEGQLESAQTRLADVLEESPRFSEGLILKGKLALLEKNGRDAARAFRTVLKDQPNSAPVHTLLGQAHLYKGEIALARESFEKAVKHDSRAFDARRFLANLDAQQGNVVQAEVQLKEILHDESRDLQSLGMLFGLQLVKQQWDEVEATVERMKEAGADRFSLALAKANAAFSQKQWQEAKNWFEQAAHIRPEDPRALIGLVQVQAKQGLLDEGRKHLEEIVSKDPHHPYAHGLLGEVLMLQDNGIAAEQEFILAQRVKSDWVLPWLNHATLTIANQKLDEAIQILQAGIKDNPDSEELQLLLASSYFELGKIDSSIAQYEAILGKNPKAILAANNLATILTNDKGDPSSLKRALELSQPFEDMNEQPFLLDTLGWVYTKLGRNEEAIRLIREAISKAPDHPALNYHLGLAYHQSGQTKEALTFLSKAVSSGQTFKGEEDAKSLLVELKG